jgi:hypothetical protein
MTDATTEFFQSLATRGHEPRGESDGHCPVRPLERKAPSPLVRDDREGRPHGVARARSGRLCRTGRQGALRRRPRRQRRAKAGRGV